MNARSDVQKHAVELTSLSEGPRWLHVAHDQVVVSDAHLLFSGNFARSGNDLVISDRDHREVVKDYFVGPKRPTLVSPDGAPLDPKFVEALTGHVAYAQAAGSNSGAKIVGHVAQITGAADVIRNGVAVTLNNGDAVYQQDVVQTGSGSSLGLVLIDGATFNLTANARLMLSDVTFDAANASSPLSVRLSPNTMLVSLVQGAASFVAGQVAKTGDMKVGTPVATIGIRGTAVILDISATDGKVSISVVDQHDGRVHTVQVFNNTGVLLQNVRSNGPTLTITPTASLDVVISESAKNPAQATQEFNVFQQVLGTYDTYKAVAPSTPPPAAEPFAC